MRYTMNNPKRAFDLLTSGFSLINWNRKQRRRWLGLGLVLALLSGGVAWRLAIRATAAGTISLTTIGSAYTQNFDTLASSGTSSTVPLGWDFSETGTGNNTTYTAGTGSSATGDTYSFGSASAADRALGGLQSGSLIPTIG